MKLANLRQMGVKSKYVKLFVETLLKSYKQKSQECSFSGLSRQFLDYLDSF